MLCSEAIMLTLFSVPKAFQGEFDVIQRNAINSWMLLRPKVEIILFGNDEGTAEAAAGFGLRHFPQVARNEYNTPLVNDVFEKAQAMASQDMLCYVNADIILMEDFSDAVSRVLARRYPSVMVGQRWDLDLGRLDFSTGWQEKIRSEIRSHGRLHAVTGIDYLVFPRKIWGEIPPFALGRTVWDNWLIYRVRSLHLPLVDATEVVTAVHQNHSYPHVQSGNAWKGPETTRNLELAGGFEHVFDLKDVTHKITPAQIRPALAWKHLERRLERFPILHPRRKISAKFADAVLRACKFVVARMSRPQ